MTKIIALKVQKNRIQEMRQIKKEQKSETLDRQKKELQTLENDWRMTLDQMNEKIKNEYKSVNPESNKFISTNDILVHWMFSFNKKADWVIVAVDMRPRLESLKKSKSFLAGNYLACPALRPEDISSPENIRTAMNDIFAKKYNNGYLDLPTTKQLMKSERESDE